MARTQENSRLAIETPLGPDALTLRSFRGFERLSEPFEYTAEVGWDSKEELDPLQLLGENVSVRCELDAEHTRFFNAVVDQVEELPGVGRTRTYRLRLVPWLKLLEHTGDCRVFQEMTVEEVVKAVFDDRGFADYAFQLEGQYPVMPYCTQYAESDLAFVSRLLEREGIGSFFRHENGKHELVMFDSASAHAPLEHHPEIDFEFGSADGGFDEGSVFRWVTATRVHTGTVAITSFDFEVPNKGLEARSSASRAHAAGNLDRFEWGEAYTTAAEGDRYAAIRTEEAACTHETVRAETNVPELATGFTFTLQDPHEALPSAAGRSYLITGTEIHLSQDGFVSGDAGEAAAGFRFTAIPTTLRYRPPRRTARPRVPGPQSAIVVGKSGEEIWTDKHGRVKVQFHWDRYGKADEHSSCWVRVATPSAGRQWGSLSLPRIGQEVIVEFLDGDPDRPIITGRVYNGANTPPYELPKNQAISTTKTNSTKGGGGFNEIRLDDTKDAEQIYVHAQHNFDTRVLNDIYEWVGHDRHLIVVNDQIEKVDNDRHETVTRDHVESIGRDRHLTVKGQEAKEVAENLSLTIKGDVIEVFKGAQSTDVSKDCFIKADNLILEGKSSITLKVGGSTIAIDASGIEIKTGGSVKIDAGSTMDLVSKAPMNLKSNATAELNSSMTTVKGSGMVVVNGGLVKIN